MVKKFDLTGSKKENQEEKKQKLKVFENSGSNLEEMISQLHTALIDKCKEFKKDEPEKWRYSVQKSAKLRWSIKMQYVQFNDFEDGKTKLMNFYLGMVSYLLDHTDKVIIEITKNQIEIKTK